MKRLFIVSGLLFAVGLLGLVSDVVRELIAALVLFCVGFGALFLVTMSCVIVHWAAQRSAMWLRIRVPQWNRAGGDRMFEFAHSPQQGRHLRQSWTHRVPTPAVPTTDTD